MPAELHIELIKLFKKPRTYIGPMAVTFLVGLVLIGMKYGHQFQHMEERLSQEFIITGSFLNAAFLTRYALLPPMLLMFLPLFTCIVYGDLLAGEAADGTIRTLLCRPVSRISVAVSKYVVGIIYSVALTFGMGLAAYILGMVFLGRGSLLSFSGGIWILPERTAIIRLIEVYALVSMGMIAIGSIAFAISAFLSNSNGAIAGAVGLVVASGIVSQIDYFAALKPYLLTTYLTSVDRFFKDKLDISFYVKSAEVMLAYMVISLIIGFVIFQRKDILS